MNLKKTEKDVEGTQTQPTGSNTESGVNKNGEKNENSSIQNIAMTESDHIVDKQPQSATVLSSSTSSAYESANEKNPLDDPWLRLVVNSDDPNRVPLW